jgi:hypothetical protein
MSAKEEPAMPKKAEDTAAHFKLPIEMQTPGTISDNLYEDLELLQVHDKDGSVPLYKEVFSPTTRFGEGTLAKWAQFYATDSAFLEDSQVFYKSMDKTTVDIKMVRNAWGIWDKLRNDDGFLEKYQYIDWDKLRWLNTSVPFLSVLTFYSIASPALNLLAPVMLLIIPFFLLKIMKIPITVKSYTDVLVQQLKRYSFGQLFTKFNEVSLSQRVYMAVCLGMYIYNIYQNILSCCKFYINTKTINEQVTGLTSYLTYTESTLKGLISKVAPLKTYASYQGYLKSRLDAVTRLNKSLRAIPAVAFDPSRLHLLGYTMKQFYLLHTSAEVEEVMLFSFGLHGFLDTIQGVSRNIQSGRLNQATFRAGVMPTAVLKGAVHPASGADAVPNTISLRHNRIITGPNAAGKTTLLKNAITNILLSQQIGYGFYTSATLTPFDYLHCYLNIPDTSARDSLFQAEARRCLKILHMIEAHPTKKHFCIFDELYSGTNPYEAIGSAYAYLEYMSKKRNVKFMLTTHFIKLCKLFRKNKRTKNCSMQASVEGDSPTYTYKVVKGMSNIKGGVCVLRQLGYPDKMIKTTHRIIDSL